MNQNKQSKIYTFYMVSRRKIIKLRMVSRKQNVVFEICYFHVIKKKIWQLQIGILLNWTLVFLQITLMVGLKITETMYFCY